MSVLGLGNMILRARRKDGSVGSSTWKGVGVNGALWEVGDGFCCLGTYMGKGGPWRVGEVGWVLGNESRR